MYILSLVVLVFFVTPAVLKLAGLVCKFADRNQQSFTYPKPSLLPWWVSPTGRLDHEDAVFLNWLYMSFAAVGGVICDLVRIFLPTVFWTLFVTTVIVIAGTIYFRKQLDKKKSG